MTDKMTLKQKARMIQERRTIDATRNNMMGASGKLGTIARFLGFPVIRQGTGMADVSYLPDPYDDVDEGIPVVDDDFLHEEGYIFDGLNRGFHFEIRYLSNNSQLTAHYKGFLVYEEVMGDLLAYAPSPEWEEKIVEPLYIQAKKRAGEMNDILAEDKRLTLIERGKAFFDDLRMRWGF